MKRSIFGAVALAAVAFTVVVVGAASGAGPTYSNGFETDTAGWFDADGTIAQRASGYDNPGDYADGINAAGGSNFAGLDRGPCSVVVGGGGDTVQCYGPYTQWGGYNATWTGGYTTQVDIYLDTAYANANPDTYGGNLADLTPPGDGTNAANKGTRFDYTSAINKAGDAGVNGHLRDFGFNVSTGYADDGCDGFMITGQTNVNRTGANPNIGGHNPQCIDESGWYTFKHTFSSKNGFLDVLMEITPVSSQTAAASWDITGIDADGTYGCNRYGWFSDQEIFGLPIDNASMTGCGTPPVTTAALHVTKFYDANANGTKDGTESDISGWKVQVANGSTLVGTTPFTASDLAPGDYTASEFTPNEANWHPTTPTSVDVPLAAGDDKSVAFGNFCTGPGGGLTVGFWTNKNGQALIGQTQLNLLTSLNLVNATGGAFVATNKAAVKNWLSNATATNMAYMLSAQLAAMELNVSTGKVDGMQLVYAPGVIGANGAGYMTVDALMAAANTELGLAGHNVTKSGSPYRSYQETLKNALDQANQDNSNSFVQKNPCTFTFPGPVCYAASGDANTAYDSYPKDVLACGPPSYAFEGNSTTEFGDKVTLGAGDTLQSMKVVFNSYGCGVSGKWYTGDCVTTAGQTFTVPGGITARIYNASDLTTPLATSNLNPAIPFRPSAIPDASCPNSDPSGNPVNSRFLNPASGLCEYSAKILLAFNFAAGTTLTSGQNYVWTVSFNTTHHGNPTAIGEGAACFGVGGGCGYDSLNVGTKNYAGAPYAGLDPVDTEAVRRIDAGSLGLFTIGTDQRPLGEIIVS